MNIVYAILVATFMLIGLFVTIKKLYNHLRIWYNIQTAKRKLFRDQGNRAYEGFIKLQKIEKRHNKEIIDRLTEIERWILQMDKFLEATNKDNASLRQKIKNIKPSTDFSFSERFAKLERRQKEYDTSLFTHGKMIGDLQKTQNEYKDRFKKVMDLKKIKVK